MSATVPIIGELVDDPGILKKFPRRSGVENVVEATGQPIAPRRTLAELEAVVDRGIKAWLEVGIALSEIRMDRLYRDGFETFEAYCQARFGFSRVRAHQLIEGAYVHKLLTSVNTVLPTHEKQIRPLHRLADDDKQEVWRKAVSDAGGKCPTAAVVEKVANSIAPTNRKNTSLRSKSEPSSPNQWEAERQIEEIIISLVTPILGDLAESQLTKDARRRISDDAAALIATWITAAKITVEKGGRNGFRPKR